MTSRQTFFVKLSIVVVIAAAGIFAINSGIFRRAEAVATIQSPPEVSPLDLSIALMRVGLDAKSLTAAGVSINSIDGVLDGVRTQLGTSAVSLAAADDSCVSFRVQVDALERKIQRGQGQAQDVSNLASARASLSSAQANQQAALNALHNAGVANLSEGQKTILANLRANKTWELPAEYLTVTRTQLQWVELRNALADERIAASHQQQPSAEAQTLLAQVRADNTVASASSNLIANLTAATTAWNQSLTP